METIRSGPELLPAEALSAGVVPINDRCTLRTEGEHRVVLVCGLALWPNRVGDRMAEAYAMASLVQGDLASQVDVARAFGCAARTVSVSSGQLRDLEGGVG
jgi:hypothetical protein